MSKHIGRAIEDDVWSASVNRPSHKIYEEDRKAQKERAKSWQPDSLQVNAERIKRGELVGVEYLWGRRAVQMIKLGMILEETLNAHRKSYMDEYKELYSEHQYNIHIGDLISRHEAAREQYNLP